FLVALFYFFFLFYCFFALFGVSLMLLNSTLLASSIPVTYSDISLHLLPVTLYVFSFTSLLLS
ncbi:hypothetical protein, partial [Methylobacterium radiotolerans]|uniref:hypothetical protein n=1 Tax=Methylobacterium radiotolerans TaxID=31998 RepID=UPI001AED0895